MGADSRDGRRIVSVCLLDWGIKADLLNEMVFFFRAMGNSSTAAEEDRRRRISVV